MKHVRTTDVLIVGGGPAGLAVASRLRAGTDGILVHQDKEIGMPVRTSGGCWLSDMQRLGIPRALAQPVTSATIYSDNEAFQLDLSSNPAGILDVTGTYKWLASQARIPLYCNAKFLSAERIADRIEARIRMNGEEVTISARHIIDASGWHCAVLNSLGLIDAAERRGIGIEYEYPAPAHPSNHAALFFGSSTPTGYGWAFPTIQQRLRLGVGIIHPVTDVSPKALMKHLLESDALERMGLPSPIGEHVNAGILPSAPYNSNLVFDGVIRVGDSANMATPTLGEGIRICIEQGWALAEALGQNTQAALKSWERAAKRKFALQYRVGFMANQRAALYTPDDWDRSVARMSQMPPEELIAFFRNEFSSSMIMRRGAQAVGRRLKAALKNVR